VKTLRVVPWADFLLCRGDVARRPYLLLDSLRSGCRRGALTAREPRQFGLHGREIAFVGLWAICLRVQRVLIGLILVGCCGATAQAEIELRGFVQQNGGLLFGLTDTSSGFSKWVREGDSFGMYRVSKYDGDQKELLLRSAASELRLKLVGPSVKSGDSCDDLPYRASAVLLIERDERERRSLAEHVADLSSERFANYVALSFTPKEKAGLRAAHPELFSGQDDAVDPRALNALITIQSGGVRAQDIQIVAHAREPELTALLANRWARKYIEYVIDEQAKRAMPDAQGLAKQGKSDAAREVLIVTGISNTNIRIVDRAEVPARKR
jgi:hypothetical protein